MTVAVDRVSKAPITLASAFTPRVPRRNWRLELIRHNNKLLWHRLTNDDRGHCVEQNERQHCNHTPQKNPPASFFLSAFGHRLPPKPIVPIPDDLPRFRVVDVSLFSCLDSHEQTTVHASLVWGNEARNSKRGEKRESRPVVEIVELWIGICLVVPFRLCVWCVMMWNGSSRRDARWFIVGHRGQSVC